MLLSDAPTLEVCIDTPAGLHACQTHVDRIELCSALSVGGLTPSAGLIAAAQASTVPVHVMIRPRAGGFTYDAAEIATCIGDIHAVQSAGLAGVVIGAARGGALDVATLRMMMDAADGLVCTLHRVIDTLDDPIAGLHQAIALGFDRVLTSGAAPKAIDGLEMLRVMQDAAKDRIEVMAGSGVTEETLAPIAHATGIRAFHASCSSAVPQSDVNQAFEFAPPFLRETDPSKILALRRVINTLA